ncbi:MAG: type II secretion system F family protein [Patescibacteria group bacterium]|nr:type II secretion system F family protein [Patescibacteria group bacterium]
MQKFFYSAQDAKGFIQTGVIEARDSLAAKKHLEQLGLLVLWVKTETKDSVMASLLQRVSIGDKAIFLRQLATMLEAGFPIDRALKIIQSETKNQFFKSIIASIGSQVEAGESLSRALNNYPKIFDAVTTTVVKSGEASGHLPKVLNILADATEAEKAFNSSLISAIIYPVFVIVAMIVVGFLVLTNFIPKIKELFDEAATQLPWQTKALIWLGDFFANYWWLIIAVILAVAIYLVWYIKNSREGRLAYERILLKIPLVKDLIILSQMARLNRLFFLMFKSATPILETIDLIAKTMPFLTYQEALKRIRTQVAKGLPFSSSLAQEGVFPTLESQLIAVGEQTGSLEKMFERLTNYYQDAANENVKRVIALVEPTVIVVLAIGVAVMVWAVFGPIYSLTQFVQQ